MIALMFSGGKDSLLALHYLKSESTEVILLFVNYGQAALEKELKALEYYAKKYEVPYKVIDAPLPQYGQLFNKTGSSYYPYRNLILIGICLSQCQVSNIDYLCFPYTLDTLQRYNDGESLFGETIMNLINTLRDKSHCYKESSKYYKVDMIRSPLYNIDTDDVLTILKAEEVDTSNVWSCYLNRDTPCGNCEKCKNTKNA
jgi:7-cyano-7-deazaguanine synthase